MQEKFPIAYATFKGGVRDRLLLGLCVVSLLLLCSMPAFSSFSMRDVAGTAITYSLSVVSAFGVLLVVFIGGALIPRDIQSRTIYSITTLPVSRSRYLLEKYLGLAMLVSYSMLILGAVTLAGIYFMAVAYPPDKPIAWVNYLFYLFFDLEKLLLLASVLVLLAAFATSSFLPMVLTLVIYAVGMTTEKVKFFLESAEGAKMASPALKVLVKVIYYFFPNFAPFDLKTQMIYALPVDLGIAATTFAYGAGYAVVMLVLATIAFSRRDFV